MALQDLTPQLRTRLSRMEREVGWFVLFAAGLLVFGFGYYIYNTAERKGWFKIKAPYYTYTEGASGLKEGDPVKLMGLDVGQITKIEPMSASQFEHNMYVEFTLKSPYYGYIWTAGSKARIATADFLGKRVLEVSKGTGGHPTYVFRLLRIIPVQEVQNLPAWLLGQDIYDATGTNLIASALQYASNSLAPIKQSGLKEVRLLEPNERQKHIAAVWNDQQGWYDPFVKNKNGEYNKYFLKSDESPAVGDRLEAMLKQVETALPDILNLTNQLANVLSNSASLTSNLNVVAVGARPAVSNLAKVTANLDQPGALGEWLLPTNLNTRLDKILGNADLTMTSAQTNLAALAENLQNSLNNLANLTSNLNNQVEANTNLLSGMSKAIVDADNFVQGLKRHWLLRSAFKTKLTNAPPAQPSAPLRSPKAVDSR